MVSDVTSPALLSEEALHQRSSYQTCTATPFSFCQHRTKQGSWRKLSHLFKAGKFMSPRVHLGPFLKLYLHFNVYLLKSSASPWVNSGTSPAVKSLPRHARLVTLSVSHSFLNWGPPWGLLRPQDSDPQVQLCTSAFLKLLSLDFSGSLPLFRSSAAQYWFLCLWC